MAIYKNIEEFKFEDITESGKHSFFLEISASGSSEQIGIPILIANGAKHGKTLVVFAAVHGDELEGVQAIQDVFNQLNTDEMSGRLIAVPTANLPAFRAVTRNSPIDGLNLARTFPGNKNGSITERIAYYLGELIIPQADFFLDLHCAFHALMPRMVGYDASGTTVGEVSKDAAFQLGFPVVWGHPDLGPGRTLSIAEKLEIPWLYVESSSGCKVSAEELPYYINAIYLLLDYLKVINFNQLISPPTLHLFGSGDVDETQIVTKKGFFVQKVELLEYVEKGQKVAEVRDIFGEILEEIFADQAGYVAVLRSNPLVNLGDLACLIAENKQD